MAPEPVDPPTAAVGARLGARLIDSMIVFVGLVLSGMFWRLAWMPWHVSHGTVAQTVPEQVGNLVILVFWLFGAEFLQVLCFGRTVGKTAASIRVAPAADPARPLTTGRALVRALCCPLLFTVLGVFTLFLESAVDVLFLAGDRRRCLHDVIAGTVVLPAYRHATPGPMSSDRVA